MKKYIKIILIIIIPLLTILWLKDCTMIQSGNPGSTRNINESKYIGVFICEYKPITNDILIDNKYLLHINEAWLESMWNYSENRRKPDIDYYKSVTKPLYFYIATNPYSIKEHLNTWWLDSFYNLTPGDETGGSIIYREMSWSEIKDTLEFRIIKLNDSSHLFENDSIGVIRFFRVK